MSPMGRPRWVVKVLWVDTGGGRTTAARRFLFTETDLRQEIPFPCGCTQSVECDPCLRTPVERATIPCRKHPHQVADVEIRRLS